MPTFLLTWNPKRWEWNSDEIGALVETWRAGSSITKTWSTGNTTKIVPGDRLVWIRLGDPPRGVFATGRATSAATRPLIGWSLHDGDMHRSEHDAVFISYPKSGRTWIRYVPHLIGNVKMKFTHAGAETSSLRILRRSGFSGLDLDVLEAKNLLMYRNPLDTAVSMYFQVYKHEFPTLRKRHGRTFWWKYAKAWRQGRLPPRRMADFVLHPTYGVEHVCAFNRAWIGYFRDRLPESPIISYEDASRDLGAVIQILARELDLEIADVEDVAARSQFSEMQRLELRGQSKELFLYGPESGGPDGMKVRRGRVRGYADYLDKVTIEAAREIAGQYGFGI